MRDPRPGFGHFVWRCRAFELEFTLRYLPDLDNTGLSETQWTPLLPAVRAESEAKWPVMRALFEDLFLNP